MQKNDIIDLTISSVTNEGMGLGRYKTDDNDNNNGFVVFVPFSAPGDTLKVRILKVTPSHAYGKIEEIVKKSNDRVKIDCEAFTKCGGCDFRHLRYESEIYAKSVFIKDAFSRLGGFVSAQNGENILAHGTEPQFLPMIPNIDNMNYRNKAQYPVGKNDKGEIVYGFYRTNSHSIIPCPDCKLHPAVFKEIMDFTVNYVSKEKISVYSEDEHLGVLRHVCIRKGHNTGQILVTIVARRKIPEFRTLARQLRTRFPDIKGVVLNINKDKTNVIMGNEEITLDGESFIFDKMCGLYIRITSASFYQVNTPAAEKLYSVVRDFAEPENKTMLDLYCGVGTIGLSMADAAKEIVGVEIVREAVRNAMFNATVNEIKNAKFICGDTGEAVAELLNNGFKPDIVILDPSRKGCEESVIKNVAALQPEKIIMVSCNPSTAARDCKEFAALGYKPEKVQGIDMFSGTAHVESVVLMTRKDG